MKNKDFQQLVQNVQKTGDICTRKANPSRCFLPARLVLSKEGMHNLSKQLSESEEATDALKEFFSEESS